LSWRIWQSCRWIERNRSLTACQPALNTNYRLTGHVEGGIMRTYRAFSGPIVATLALWVAAGAAHATLMALAIVFASQTSAPFNYTITLHNTGTTNIGTFWFGWVPGADFLPTTPTNILMPTGWSASLSGGGADDGHSIEFVDNGSLLTAGSSLPGFGFTSNDSPTQLAGKSPFFSTMQATTSVVYSGGLFSDSGFQFTASVVPEPTALALAGAGGLVMLLACWQRRRIFR
jgi:hypothetical protein